MDIGALTNASAKISSVKPLTFTQWLICAPDKNSRSPSVCRASLWRDGIAKKRWMRVDIMPKKKRERTLAVFQNTVIC